MGYSVFYVKTLWMTKGILLICLLGISMTAHAGGAVTGPAHVHDGDTIRIGTQSIRIWGIDAVELKQTCLADSVRVPCGVMARDSLARLVAGHEVTCVQKGRSYQRIVATCSVGGVDVASAMTRMGMAHDYAHYSHGYYAEYEHEAKKRRAGIWAMEFDDPAHWRACNLPQRKNHRPGDCLS